MKNNEITGNKKFIAKWGFGMAPISQRMRKRYDDAVQHLTDILYGNLEIQEVNPDLLSEIKGMMNRCIREDQWDWFTVFSELGAPPRRILRRIVSQLISMRRAIIDNNKTVYENCLQCLVSINILQFLHIYQNNLSSQTFSSDAGWIYILSTRKQPDILKIGRTDRSVAKRVNEINSATGILIPWAARRVYRVRNSCKAESEIHCKLELYRLRKDREFFKISLDKAVNVIDGYLQESEQRDRWSGKILWFNRNKGIGFLTCSEYSDVFFHKSQLIREEQDYIVKDAPVTYLLERRPQGPCAIDVRLIKKSEAIQDNS